MLRSTLLFVVLAWTMGCGIVPEEESKLADGARCDEAKQCQSGVCTRDALCAPSVCDCPGDSCPAQGAHSADCGSEWVCVASTNLIEGVGEFFGAGNDNDGYCQLPCSAGCLDHYLCSGDFCVPEVGWADPVPSVTWSGAAEGALTGKGAETTVEIEREKAVALSASASSPSGSKIESFSWNLVDDSGIPTMSSGAMVDLTIDAEHTFRRAELTVSDAKMSASLLYVIFQACSGNGEPCGFEGSGCCKACDTATNLCE
jgi:hypothetical protein